MQTKISKITLLCLLASLPILAQPAGFGGRTQSPQILPDNRITFQVRAPQAQQVQVDLGRLYDMERDERGVWQVTTDPQVPGFHYYFLVIDGVRVADPTGESYYGVSMMATGVDIPEPGIDFYTIKDIPHGDIRSKRYFSKVTDSWRRLNIYTPPGYDQDQDKKYPVLYLQHGGGENETGWAIQGKTDIILDNLIAAGKAEPMLIVMANGNVPSSGGRGGYSRESMVNIGNELIQNIVPFVEENYRVIPDAQHRALAGLSMGGGQAFYVGLQHPDIFASIGVFSSGLFGGIGSTSGSAFDAEAQIPGLLTEAESFNEKLDLFYISVGQQDPRIEHTKKAIESFKEHDLEVIYSDFPGDHEWQVWRKSLHDMAQRLFKD